MNHSTTLARSKRRTRPASAQSLFLKGFFKHPVMVGSIIPSSNRTIRRMLDPIDWSQVKTIVEYGPGVGTFCQPVLDRLAPDAQLIAIDTNLEFVEYLRDAIRDSRFSVVHGSAEDVGAIVRSHGAESADYILSGLPFSTLPPGLADIIGRETYAALRPGGAFLVYQFNPRVRDIVAPHFDRVDSGFELWNVPPAHLWWAWKNEAGD